MRISQAGIRNARPTTRFAISTGDRRERQLGLNRGSSRRLAASSKRPPTVSALSALRQATRGLTTIGIGLAPTGRATAPVIGALRRADAIKWSQPTHSGPRRPRPRSAAPWRG
jgi:hypothetical protein